MLGARAATINGALTTGSRRKTLFLPPFLPLLSRKKGGREGWKQQQQEEG